MGLVLCFWHSRVWRKLQGLSLPCKPECDLTLIHNCRYDLSMHASTHLHGCFAEHSMLNRRNDAKYVRNGTGGLDEDKQLRV